MPGKNLFPVLVILILLAACSPGLSAPNTTTISPDPSSQSGGKDDLSGNPYAPGKGDEAMSREDVFIYSQNILMENSFPPVYQLQVKGSLPTPCHHLRAVVDVPNMGGEIDVQLYSVVDASLTCTQVQEAFQATIPLGSYVRGSYTVYENGQKIGEITP